MCIYKGIDRSIKIHVTHQIKSTLNSQKIKFQQILYKLNIICLQYIHGLYVGGSLSFSNKQGIHLFECCYLLSLKPRVNLHTKICFRDDSLVCVRLDLSTKLYTTFKLACVQAYLLFN